MHPLVANKIVESCQARSSEGDSPVTPPESIERLEQCVIELTNQLQVFSADQPSIQAYKMFRKERQRREAAESINKRLIEALQIARTWMPQDPDETMPLARADLLIVETAFALTSREGK